MRVYALSEDRELMDHRNKDTRLIHRMSTTRDHIHVHSTTREQMKMMEMEMAK